MDKAKAAVSSFLSKDGKHDTTVHESINPAVKNEHVTRTEHEETQTLVDREIHQHHHHTTVQPVKDREVLPEKHSHNVVGVEHRQIQHGNDNHVKQRLEAEAAQFKDTREVGETKHTASVAPVVAGEHVHHHVHETIQPVVQKEVIQPSVIHTTIPVHEVHTNEPKHHAASALPAISMSEFQKQGGSLGGRAERTDAFLGEPKSVGTSLGGKGAAGSTSLTEKDGAGHHHAHNGVNGLNDNNTNSTTASSTSKPSLMDKINPKIDSNGDGQAGFMK